MQPRTTTDGRNVHTAIVHDRTVDHAEQRSLIEQLGRDHLTGLANRAQFLTALSERISTDDATMRPAVIFCDLDGFKAVNSTHGHAAGDRLLQLAAERITNAIRTDDIAARLGGDEFVVLTTSPCQPVVEVLATRLRDAFRAPFRLDDTDIEVTASIGIALADPGMSTDVVAMADNRMYAAKRTAVTRPSGRNAAQSLTPPKSRPPPSPSEIPATAWATLAPYRPDGGRSRRSYEPLVPAAIDTRKAPGYEHAVALMARTERLAPQAGARSATKAGPADDATVRRCSIDACCPRRHLATLHLLVTWPFDISGNVVD